MDVGSEAMRTIADFQLPIADFVLGEISLFDLVLYSDQNQTLANAKSAIGNWKSAMVLMASDL
jgi:hypothetical protein